MYGVTLAHALSLQPPSRRRTIQVFCTIGITAILSWPFALALACVLFLHDLAQAPRTKGQMYDFLRSIVAAGAIVLLALVSVIDESLTLSLL
jgi:hypothetical protein